MSKQIGILHGALTVAAAVAFVATWSSGFVIAAFATADTSALTLLVWRFVLLAIVLLLLVGATRAARGVTPRELGVQAAIGLFAQFGYCAAVWGAVAAGIATGTVALIDAVQPLVVAALVGPLLGLRVRGAQWAGLGVGAIGVALVVHSQLGSAAATPAAYLLPLAAMVCLVIGTFLQRRSSAHTGVLVTLAVQVTVTAVVLLVIALLAGALVPPATAGFWTSVALAAVFPTLGAYGLYWWLLRRVGITALQALLFLIAPATALAGALLLGEPLTVLTAAGFVLCAGGVTLVLAGEREARTEGAEAQGRTRTARPSNATTSPSCS
ncbi:DMT family transporter [Microbacterium sp. K35]|uniref:DMT family transporter n=1 Tax=Microbacterium sp. K35 TaxID=2305440 RepID=UPI001F0D0D2A|nr:DMT family transporter [Microbacterium sp. K35]